MKRAILKLILVAAGLILFGVVQATAGGYKDFRWGMTVNEVRSLEPDLKADDSCLGVLVSLLRDVLYYENDITTRLEDADYIPNGELTCAETENYYFEFLDGGLVSVNVFFPRTELSPLDALTKKYGPLPSKDYREWMGAEYYWTSVRVWTRVSEDRIILLTEIDETRGGRTSSSLSYLKPSVCKEASENVQRILKETERKLRKSTEQKID